MEWSEVLKYIQPELFIMIVFVWCVGLFLKKNPAFKAEWSIPFILWGLSIAFTILYVGFVFEQGFAPPVIIANIIQGTIIAAVAVFGNEAIKQVSNKRHQDGD